MELCNTLFSAVFNLLGIYIDVRFIKIFNMQKDMCKSKKIMIYIIAWLINWNTHFFCENVYMTVLSAVINIMLIVFLIFEGSIIRRIVTILLAIALPSIVEVLLFLISNHYQWYINNALGSFISSIIWLLIVITLEHFCDFNKDIKLTFASYLSMIFVGVGSTYIAISFFKVQCENSSIPILSLTILGMINVGIYYLYAKVHEFYQETVDKAILEQRVKMYTNQFSLIKQSQDQMSSLRHDMKNHMLLLKSYITTDRKEQAIQYINQMTKEMENGREFVRSGNQEVDSILNYMLGKARAINCEIEVMVKVPNGNFMQVFDLNILLSNLLENALEALEKTETRKLIVQMKYDKEIIYIKINNTFDGVVKKQGDRFMTLKEYEYGHGIGMGNIQKIVDKYHGNMSIQIENNEFQTIIILFVPQTQVW